MSKTKKPVTAARAIVRMINRGEAKSAADAVEQRPELKSGLDMINGSLATTSSTKSRGSGSALLSR